MAKESQSQSLVDVNRIPASAVANQYWVEAGADTLSTLTSVRDTIGLHQESQAFIGYFMRQMKASDLVAYHSANRNYQEHWKRSDLKAIETRTNESFDNLAKSIFDNNTEVIARVREKSREIARRINGLGNLKKDNLLLTLGNLPTDLEQLINANKLIPTFQKPPPR